MDGGGPTTEESRGDKTAILQEEEQTATTMWGLHKEGYKKGRGGWQVGGEGWW